MSALARMKAMAMRESALVPRHSPRQKPLVMAPGSGRKPCPAVAMRRAEAVRLADMGIRHSEIAARLGVSRNLVKQDVWQVRRKA